MGNLQVAKGHAFLINDSLYIVCSVQFIHSINKQHRWQSSIFKLHFIFTHSDIKLLLESFRSLHRYVIEKVPNVNNAPHFPKSKASIVWHEPCSSFLVKKLMNWLEKKQLPRKDVNTLPPAHFYLIYGIWSWAYHLIRVHILSQSESVPWRCAISLHLRFDSAALKATETIPLTCTNAVQGCGAL